MNDNPIRSKPGWGIHINDHFRYRHERQSNYPEWISRHQRDKWNEQGVIIWDEAARQITKIKASQALELIELLSNTSDWKENGCVVGEIVWRVPLEKPEEGRWALANTIHLNPDQSKEMLSQLSRDLGLLKQMADQEEKDKRKALGEVYAYLIEIGHKRKARQEVDKIEAEEHKGEKDL